MTASVRPIAQRPGLWALIGIVGAIVAWELWVRVADVEPFITIAPSKIAEEILDNPRFWLEQTWLTAWHTLVGVGVALGLALLVGALLAASRPLEWATQPLLVIVMVTPWVAYITSVVNWLGPGTPTILFMVAFVTFPALVFAAVQGMRSADIAAREVLASVDAARAEVFWKLRLPSAMPSLFTAARFATGLGLAAAYFAEGGSVAAGVGLGEVGRRGAQNTAGGYQILWASIVCAALLGVTLLVSVTGLERRVLRWHASQRSTAT
jgi:NitT/TauT family transport system permease protein